MVFSVSGYSQTGPSPITQPWGEMPSRFQLSAPRMKAFPEDADATPANNNPDKSRGLVGRTVRRGLNDQKTLYAAPFKLSNIKWDVLALAGTGALFATDRRIEKQLPDSNFQRYQNSSNIAMGGLAVSLAGVWIYGIKTENPHLREMGNLELETLTSSFLIYTPMQFIAGRQRPGEGNGYGDFWRHHAMNTSFPGGHAMFAWSMATVAAHEYPKTWVRLLAYGAAGTITVSRFMAHDHWASDSLLGSVLGFSIGTHIFHKHCDPELSPSCHR